MSKSKDIVHQITFDLVPMGLIKDVVDAAIHVVWASDNGDCFIEDKDAEEKMQALSLAVSKLYQYTIPVDLETGIPV